MSVEPKNWLCIITSDKEAENIDEMTRDIWSYFDGICATVHTQGGDGKVVQLLNERKKDGFIIERNFPWHIAHSRNETLLDRRINLKDMIWIRDSMERFTPQFASEIKQLSEHLLANNIWNVFQYSKLLAFRRWYNQQFVNGIHTGVAGLYGNSVSLDKIPAFADEKSCSYSVRDQKRSFDHRYRHEVFYLLDYAANGNHLALFHNDPKELDKAQWSLYEFIGFLAEQGVHGVDQFGEWLKLQDFVGGMDKKVVAWINAERPFRNYYRYYVLKHKNEDIVKDENEWRIT